MAGAKIVSGILTLGREKYYSVAKTCVEIYLGRTQAPGFDLGVCLQKAPVLIMFYK